MKLYDRALRYFTTVFTIDFTMDFTTEHALIAASKAKIEAHPGSYSFLYTPPSSLFSPYVFVGLMPGGYADDPCNLFVEKGNAYVDEKWDKSTGSYNKLQKQVLGFFTALSRHIGVDKWDDWMSRNWLISNYVFYRSEGWDTMKRQKDHLRVCSDIWRSIFAVSVPKIIVCYGIDTYKGMKGLICERGFTVRSEEKTKGRWINPDIAVLHNGGQQCLLIGFGCFSRFGIIGRAENKAALDMVYQKIKEHL